MVFEYKKKICVRFPKEFNLLPIIMFTLVFLIMLFLVLLLFYFDYSIVLKPYIYTMFFYVFSWKSIKKPT